jgi:5-methylcytosine-specific restriction enzyme A
MTDRYYHSDDWVRLRQVALERDGHRCVVQGCGARATVVDHIVSRRAGGSDSLDNLRSLCRRHDDQVKEGIRGQRKSGGTPWAIGCDAQGRPLDPLHWWNKP